MARRSFALCVASFLVAIVGCASSQPPPQETLILRSPSAAVPPYLRELVSGKTLGLYIPNEMRPVAIDYLRAAGAIIVEGGQPELQLDGSWKSETVYYPLGLSVNSSRVHGQRAIVELQLKGLRPDGARQILLQGRGEAIHDASNSARGVNLAGRRALLNLH